MLCVLKGTFSLQQYTLILSLILFLYVKCDIIAVIFLFWFYFQEDFDVDHFVSDCRKRVQLEELRDDLELYYKLLKTAMVELINKDYADFVNLSTNLVNHKSEIFTVSIYTHNTFSLIFILKCAVFLETF